MVRENKKKEEEGRMLERKSRTPVMPWDGMRIDEPGRGPWCENEKKGEEEWRRKGVADSCYASGWHENRGARSRTVVEKKKKKKKGRMEEKRSSGLLLCHAVA